MRVKSQGYVQPSVQTFMKRSRSRTLPLFALVVAVSLPASMRAANGKSEVQEIGNRKVAHRSIVSQEKEVAIGKQFAAEIDRSAKLIKGPVITEHVKRVAQSPGLDLAKQQAGAAAQ